MKPLALAPLFRVGLRSALAVVIILHSAAWANNVTERESAIKAGFIFNFAKFTTWPGGVTEGSGKFVFCVVENPEFAKIFRREVSGKIIGGLPVEVADVLAGENVGLCHVLYVPQMDAKLVDKTMTGFPRRLVLSVGDSPQFIAKGGIITFHVDGGRLRFQVCPSNAGLSGLFISSELLGLARTGPDCR